MSVQSERADSPQRPAGWAGDVDRPPTAPEGRC